MYKATLNTSGYDDDDALFFLRLLNDASPDPVQDHELVRLVANAHRGRWTSTGCDDPLHQCRRCADSAQC